MRLSYDAVPASVGDARAAIDAFARRNGVDERRREDIALAVSEAATNVVQHAYANEGTGPPGFDICAHLRSHALVVVVEDHGSGLRPRTDSPGLGLGLQLIEQVAQNVEIEDGSPGMLLRMTFAAT